MTNASLTDLEFCHSKLEYRNELLRNDNTGNGHNHCLQEFFNAIVHNFPSLTTLEFCVFHAQKQGTECFFGKTGRTQAFDQCISFVWLPVWFPQPVSCNSMTIGAVKILKSAGHISLMRGVQIRVVPSLKMDM